MSANNPATNVKVVQHVDFATYTSTQTPSTGVDTKGYTHALVIVNTGTFTGDETMTLTVEESSEEDGATDTFAAVTSAALAAISTSNDAQVHVGQIYLQPRERYLRTVCTQAGTGNALYGVTFVLFNANQSSLNNNTYGFSV